jgi:hypothetical protein
VSGSRVHCEYIAEHLENTVGIRRGHRAVAPVGGAAIR